ncbi:unnamed protein product [Sphagnum jensenii]|uniref:beta-glucosidase n=1 Tax=Sphagnum jensenii TaxID=128206 RepID=A0ABP0WVQ4_9BRYO
MEQKLIISNTMVMSITHCCLATTTSTEGTFVYKDPEQPIALRVKDLLSRMTLEEKIGQMTQIEREVSNSSVIQRYHIGSILSGGGSVPAPKATPELWDNMIDDFQRAALNTRLGIPLLYGIDAVHGNNNVYRATIFPHNVGLGATRDPILVEKIGAATALEVRATGIQYAFAPCVAVCRDPRWGRCYESYSEDPEVVRTMTTIIDGLQGRAPAGWKGPYVQSSNKVAACAKHFVGDGGTRMGINENDTVISYDGLVSIHMRPYFDAVTRGVSSIMASYSSWNGVKMHANRFLLTDVLKGQLGFKGFIISDWQGIDRITSPPDANYTFSILAGIHAGIDMVMVPYMYEQFISNLTYEVKNGNIPMSRIDDAVARILQVKFETGLFEHPYANKELKSFIGQQAHRSLAREAVRKSLVLLKNGKNGGSQLLPLNRDAKKVLVVGAHANDIGLQCGGWTISWHGKAGNTTHGTTILEGIKEAMGDSSEIVYAARPDKDFAKGRGFEYAIVVIGESPYSETQGDNQNLTIPSQGIEILENTCRAVKCLVILISGRPLVVEPYLQYVDAFVSAWLPGTEGNGIADVVFGDYDFVGKLPRTWFRSVAQLPLNIGDKHYDPLFPFGFGLKMGLEKHK